MILHIFTRGYTPDSPLQTIAVRSHTGEVRFFSDISAFTEYFLQTDDKIVVGFNILKFDIPYILLNCTNELRAALFKKINFSQVIDLFPILTFQNKGIIKGLDFYLEKYAIKKTFPQDPVLVQDVEKNKSAITQKMDALHELYWALKKLNAPD